MGQSAAQWARSMIEWGADENNIVEIIMNGVPTRMALWDMASMAEVSDMLDKETTRMRQATIERKSNDNA